MALHVLGLNIAPLLTVGGVSGVIVGLSAQSVMSNMISGINLVRASRAQPSKSTSQWNSKPCRGRWGPLCTV